MSQVATPIASSQPPVIAPKKVGFFSPENRYLAPILISCILLAGQLSFGILESYKKTLLAIVTSLAAELILGKIFYGKWMHPASAYISGISVGILVRSPAYLPDRKSTRLNSSHV